MVQSYKDLEVWKKSIILVTDIYKHTAGFPKEEAYGLTNQLRRASASIPANLAKGRTRNTTKQYLQFVSIARGSAAEVETFLLIAKNLNYLTLKEYEIIIGQVEEIAKMMNKLQSSLKAINQSLSPTP